MTHGDLTPGNVLVSGGRLAGILDVGGLGPADPALDLVAAWHLLEARPRRVSREALASDDLQWERGQGVGVRTGDGRHVVLRREQPRHEPDGSNAPSTASSPTNETLGRQRRAREFDAASTRPQHMNPPDAVRSKYVSELPRPDTVLPPEIPASSTLLICRTLRVAAAKMSPSFGRGSVRCGDHVEATHSPSGTRSDSLSDTETGSDGFDQLRTGEGRVAFGELPGNRCDPLLGINQPIHHRAVER